MSTLSTFKNYIQKETDLKLEEILIELLFREFFANLSSSLHPKLIVLGGSPGSGKTNYRRNFLDVTNFHIHDMDEVLIRLPGYQKDCEQSGIKTAFEKWWPIAQKIANAVVRFAFRHHYNVIYDRTCGTEESFSDLKAIYENKQYHVVIYGFWVYEEIALAQVKKREKVEKRTVTPEITKEYLARFSALWLLYIDIANEIYLLNNNPGFGYARVYERVGSVERILNADHYRQFLSSANGINFVEKFPRLGNINKLRHFPNPYSMLHVNHIGKSYDSKDTERNLLIKSKL